MYDEGEYEGQQSQSDTAASRSQKVLKIISQRGDKGISLHELLEASGMAQKVFELCLRGLKAANRIEVSELNGKQTVRVADVRDTRHLQLIQEELASRDNGAQLFEVYEKVYRQRGRGVESKELKAQLVRLSVQMSRLLGDLVKYSYVYTRQSKKQKGKRKLYLSKQFEFEEDVEQGALFKEGESNQELIAQLTEELRRMFAVPYHGGAQSRTVKNTKLMSRAEIATRLKMTCNQNLEEKDIEKLLNIWQFDELIEKVTSVEDGGTKSGVAGGERVTYKFVHWEDFDNSIVYKPPLTKMPCGNCPVRAECRVGHKISPENCIYFNNLAEW